MSATDIGLFLNTSYPLSNMSLICLGIMVWNSFKASSVNLVPIKVNNSDQVPLILLKFLNNSSTSFGEALYSLINLFLKACCVFSSIDFKVTFPVSSMIGFRLLLSVKILFISFNKSFLTSLSTLFPVRLKFLTI